MEKRRTLPAVMMGAVMLLSWRAATGAPADVLPAIAAALSAGTPARAAQLADDALTGSSLSRPERSRLLLDRGLARDALGRHDDALADLTEAVEAHALPASEQARALFDRGTVLDGMGRLGDALGDYGAALVLAPGWPSALTNRANALRRLGRLAEAKAGYRAALAVQNPVPGYAWYGLGQIAEAEGDAGAARGFYAKAVTDDPGYGLAAARLAALGGPPDRADAVHLHLPAASAHSPPEATPVHLVPPRQPFRQPGVTPASYRGSGPPLRPALDASGGPEVQLGAWRSQAEAVKGWDRALRRAEGTLDGLTPHIMAVDLPGRGRFYRLRVRPAKGTDRTRLCAALGAKGLDCIPARD